MFVAIFLEGSDTITVPSQPPSLKNMAPLKHSWNLNKVLVILLLALVWSLSAL